MVHLIWGKYSKRILVGIISGISIMSLVQMPYSQTPSLPPSIEPDVSTRFPFNDLSLEDCIEIALESNHRTEISKYAVFIAEAQHQEALSGYWPQLTFKGGYQRTDEPLNYLFPSSEFLFPGSIIQIPPGSTSVTIPENAFAPGFPSSTVDLPIQTTEQGLRIPPQYFQIPEQNILLKDVDTYSASLELQWLL